MLISAATGDISPFYCEVFGSVPANEKARDAFKDVLETATLLHWENPNWRGVIFTGMIRLPVKKG